MRSDHIVVLTLSCVLLLAGFAAATHTEANAGNLATPLPTPHRVHGNPGFHGGVHVAAGDVNGDSAVNNTRGRHIVKTGTGTLNVHRRRTTGDVHTITGHGTHHVIMANTEGDFHTRRNGGGHSRRHHRGHH